MEAGIYCVIDIHDFINIHSTIITQIYNKQGNTQLKLLPKSKAIIPKWDKHDGVRQGCELRKVAALFSSSNKVTG